MWFSLVLIQLQVLSQRSGGMVSLRPNEISFEGDSRLLQTGEMEARARDWLLEVDEAARLLYL